MEAVANIDLSGKTAIVTGGYSGLGLETTRALAAAGAAVLVPARRVQHARNELAALGDLAGEIEIEALDLGDLSSVESFATGFLATQRGIDLLINNAAIMACPETRLAGGWEAQFATNHLGHFALTQRLYPALVRGGGARVVALSSSGHRLSPVRWDDVMFERGPYDKWRAYGQAKTANCLFAVELDRRARGDDVRAFAVHPGGIMTPLQRHLKREEMIASGWMDREGKVNAIFKNPGQGASTSVWAATSPALAGMGGVYCEDCDIATSAELDKPEARYRGVHAHAIDPEAARRLWALSVELTGIDAIPAA